MGGSPSPRLTKGVLFIYLLKLAALYPISTRPAVHSDHVVRTNLFYFLTVSNVFPSLLPGVIQTPVGFNRLSSVQLQSNTIDVKDTLASLIASKYVTDIDLNSNEYW